VSTSHVSRLSVERCAVIATDGRLQATGGDGVHLKYGRDIVVRDCHFEGLSDDAVNVSATIGFAIENNAFVDKRRHGIVLDTDGVPYRSRSGLIRGNRVERNGGSLFHHDGGDYGSVAVAGNVGVGNDRARAVERASPGRLMAELSTSPGFVEPKGDGNSVAELRWQRRDTDALLRIGLDFKDSSAGGASGRWRWIREATARGHRIRLEALSAQGDPHPWAYLGVGQDGGLSLAPSERSWSPRAARVAGPDGQSWVVESLPGGWMLLRHEVTGAYLSADGVSVTLAKRENATRWRFAPEP
ncbi:MAG: right-handed parallel beta-helix repeat-containing protein, partial [Planctomycetota bacterium]